MTKLQKLRTDAFNSQHGRCYYCNQPMWIKSPTELEQYGLRPSTAKPLRCTAEHLTAQQDGGRDVEGNIAAACRFCNFHRHKRKTAHAPENYRNLVQNRLAKGKWHSISV